MALSYSQVLSNILSFEAEELVFLDFAISNKDKHIPREAILGLTGLSEEKNKKKYLY